MKLFVLCCFSFLLFLNTAIAQPNLALPPKLATTTVLKTPTGVAGQANGIKTGLITVAIDTGIRVAPTYAYISVDFSKLTGTNQMDILNGNHLFWVFDKTGKQIIIPLKVLYRAKAAMEDNSTVDLSIRIPYRLKADKNIYTIHYRWESKDKSRNLDLLTSK